MKTYKKLHESKEAATKHIAKIKKREGKVKQSTKDGKILLEYSFPIETVKKGKIKYKSKIIPSSIAKKQIALSKDISKILSDSGHNVEVEYGSGTIDINVEVGEKRNNRALNMGIFRIFWSSTSDYKIGYLCAGEPHFDGYEVHRKWKENLSLNEVLKTFENDISDLNKYRNKYK